MRSIAFLFLACLIGSCQSNKEVTPMNYKYGDQEQVINCEGQNNALLNEALYSFEDDLLNTYDAESRRPITAYGQFTFVGLSGQAEFKRIVSEHSKIVLSKLIEEGIIIKNTGAKSNVNYEHPAVVCAIDNLKDAALKKTINALISTNSMDPVLFDSRLRNAGRLVQNQRYLAFYLSLDAYFQQLANLDMKPTE